MAQETRPYSGQIIGKIFGKLEVISIIEEYSGKLPKVECRCECGKIEPRQLASLVHGERYSTAVPKCFKCRNASEVTRKRMSDSSKIHGLGKHPLHSTWSNMINRCYDPRNKTYEAYGGRGIAVCDRWRDPITGLATFIEDMGPKPTPRHEIDRRNNSGNYEPCNCQWVTHKQNMWNVRTNRLVTAFGRTQSISAWSDELGANVRSLRQRLFGAQMSPEEAFTLPFKDRGIRDRTFNFQEEELTIPEIAKRIGIRRQAVYNRLVIQGWSVERLIAVGTIDARGCRSDRPTPPKDRVYLTVTS